MINPPRPAAIAVKLITGDHLVTARAIAGQIGLAGREDDGKLAALSGRELEKISDAELSPIAERTAVFARVAPEQKLRLVKALQSRGHVVAMTGDDMMTAILLGLMLVFEPKERDLMTRPPRDAGLTLGDRKLAIIGLSAGRAGSPLRGTAGEQTHFNPPRWRTERPALRAGRQPSAAGEFRQRI